MSPSYRVNRWRDNASGRSGRLVASGKRYESAAAGSAACAISRRTPGNDARQPRPDGRVAFALSCHVNCLSATHLTPIGARHASRQRRFSSFFLVLFTPIRFFFLAILLLFFFFQSPFSIVFDSVIRVFYRSPLPTIRSLFLCLFVFLSLCLARARVFRKPRLVASGFFVAPVRVRVWSVRGHRDALAIHFQHHDGRLKIEEE